MPDSRPSPPRYAIDWTPIRHSASFRAGRVEFRVAQHPHLTRADLALALTAATGRLRETEAAFQPGTRHGDERRRAAIMAAVMAGSRRVQQATSGYFDPWALPSGFDPAGLLAGWALERAAQALSAAQLRDFAILANDELLVRGNAPDAAPWRVGIRHPGGGATTIALTDAALSTSAGAVIDPHTQQPAEHWHAVSVVGPDLGIADAYATGLRAAGPAGLSWFPTADGYRTVLLTAPRPTGPPETIQRNRPATHGLGRSADLASAA